MTYGPNSYIPIYKHQFCCSELTFTSANPIDTRTKVTLSQTRNKTTGAYFFKVFINDHIDIVKELDEMIRFNASQEIKIYMGHPVQPPALATVEDFTFHTMTGFRYFSYFHFHMHI